MGTLHIHSHNTKCGTQTALQLSVLKPLSLHSMLVVGLLVFGHTIKQWWRMIGVSAIQLTCRGFSAVYT